MAKRTTKKQTEATGLASTANCTIAELHCRFVQNGDDAACTEIVQRFHGMVLATARRVVSDMDDAEDVCQDTFAQYLKNAAALRNPKALPGWLRTTATRLAWDAAAERRKQHHGHEGLDLTPANLSPPDYLDEHDDTLAVVREERARLPELERMLLEDIYWGDMTWAAAAAKRGTSQTPINRALELMRGLLERRCGIDAFGALLAALWPKGDASASVLPAIGKPSAAAAGSGTAWVKVAMKTTLTITAGMWRAVRALAANKGRFAYGLVVLLAFCLQFLPANNPAPPSYLVGKFDSSTLWSEVEGLKCIYVSKQVFEIQRMSIAGAENPDATLVFGLPNIPEGKDGVRLFVRSISDDRKHMLRRRGFGDVEGEVFYVPPADEKPLVDEVARRAHGRSSDSCWDDLSSLWQTAVRTVFGCN